jgi:anti-sigma regulatory factor (Ser/Thr protein kinase)
MDTVHAALDGLWMAMDDVLAHPPGETWRLHVATAVAEVAGNVIRYALASGLSATMDVRLLPDRLEVAFHDRGAPCPGPALLPPTDADPLDDLDDLDALEALAESGRGIAIARVALDDLAYMRTPNGENVWTLTKRLAGPVL